MGLRERVTKVMGLLSVSLSRVGLKINEGKTRVMVMLQKGSKIGKMAAVKFVADEVEMASCESLKYLGVVIDWRLTFEEHLNYLVRILTKVQPIIGALCHNTYGYHTI